VVGLLKSMARSRVAIVLKTSTIGTNWPALHVTCSIPGPSTEFRTSDADWPLVDHSFPSERNQSVWGREGSGIHACVGPSGSLISMRVQSWNRRHGPGSGANVLYADAARGTAESTDSATPALTKSRLLTFTGSRSPRIARSSGSAHGHTSIVWMPNYRWKTKMCDALKSALPCPSQREIETVIKPRQFTIAISQSHELVINRNQATLRHLILYAIPQNE
jgi:hypothetical protein